MKEVHYYNLNTHESGCGSAAQDKITDEVVEYGNKLFRHVYYWAGRVFEAVS